MGVLSWKAVCTPMEALVARHEAHAGATRELAVRLGHEGRPALLPAGDKADAIGVRV
jgi:hypothetical protein